LALTGDKTAKREEASMGLKDWLAGKVAGPQSYGDVMGRQAREGGSALANVVFISHGAQPTGGPTTIFDTQAEMKAAGYKPRFSEIVEIDLDLLTKDEQSLFRSLQTAMISFAFIVNSNVALQYMRRENTSRFRNGLGPSLLRSMVECGLFDRIETAQSEVLSYANLVDSTSASTVLNMDKPAAGDVLEQFIVRAVAVSGSTLHYAFTRTGLTGFDLMALPLAQETVKAIYGAATKYGW
jgi:hypothetical protein